jgi:hypothetical protein
VLAAGAAPWRSIVVAHDGRRRSAVELAPPTHDDEGRDV